MGPALVWEHLLFPIDVRLVGKGKTWVTPITERLTRYGTTLEGASLRHDLHVVNMELQKARYDDAHVIASEMTCAVQLQRVRLGKGVRHAGYDRGSERS